MERFQDSYGDGVGDLPGLTARLEHLVELGVTCVWLLPFYATPNRDNGYHTCDQHPWFQAARRDAGSRYRDHYVCSKSPPPVPLDSGPIFPGQESSVWTWDDLAGAYF